MLQLPFQLQQNLFVNFWSNLFLISLLRYRQSIKYGLWVNVHLSSCYFRSSGMSFTIDIIDTSFLDSAETRSFSFSTRMMLLQFPESSKHYLVNLYLVFSVADTTVVTPNPLPLFMTNFLSLLFFLLLMLHLHPL